MALIHRFGSEEEGIEFPLQEPITKETLCAIFDASSEHDVHIFHENDYEMTLELPESYFEPKTAGKYVVAFELEDKEGVRKLLELSRSLKDYKPGKFKIKQLDASTDSVATLYAYSAGTFAVPLGTEITKEFLCSMFNRPIETKIDVNLKKDQLATFYKGDLTKKFVLKKPGFYHIWFDGFDGIDQGPKKTEKPEGFVFKPLP